jgi:hypothetical protein
MKRLISLLMVIGLNMHLSAQDSYIYTKEGDEIMIRRFLVNDCLRNSLHKDASDDMANYICNCRVSKLDRRFTRKQYRKHTSGRRVNIAELIKEDSLLQKEMDECFTSSGQTTLLQAEGFENEFIADCIKSIIKNTEKTLDSNRVRKFCKCQLELVKTRKIGDKEMGTLSNPNSLLFYEMMYKCGNPYIERDGEDGNWNPGLEKDIRGPASDTINILPINGMAYLKMKTGSLVQVWLFDTGASDLLINTDMERDLKKENILNDSNYLGIGEYEMANGMIDSCRKYRVNDIRIGEFAVDNVVVAVTEKGKRIIVGRALLNKFSRWLINNQNNSLILVK